jgi:hypothetical protein
MAMYTTRNRIFFCDNTHVYPTQPIYSLIRATTFRGYRRPKRVLAFLSFSARAN